MQVGEAFVAVRPDTSGFGPELQRGVETSGRQAASGLSQALTAGIAVAGFNRLIGSASDLNESMNKTRATFGDASSSVEAFASTSADSFGISEAAALDLAGGLGAMLIPLGTSQQEAADMSTRLLELAADMGSFNNQDPTEMLDRLRSGLAGEAEPLRQFGVTLSEARVQQFAWQNGIAESGVALTEQQKIMARYGLILEDTAVQQGDFANTADSAANAQRRAAATAEDSAASIGSNFIPVYEQGVAAVQGLAAAFGSLPGPLQAATVLLAGFAAFKGPLTGIFSAVSAGVRAMAENFKAAGGGVKGLGSALSAGAIIGGIAVIGLGLITNAMAKQAQTAEETKNRVKGLADAYTEGGIAAAGQTFLSQLAEDAPEVLDALNGLEGGAGDFISAIGEGGDTAARAMDELGAAIAGVPLDVWEDFMAGTGGFIPGDQQTKILEAQHALNLFAETLPTAITTSGELAGAQEDVAEATGTAADSLDDQASALSDVAQSADDAKDKLDALFGIQRSVAEGAIAIRDGARDLYQAFLDMNGQFVAGSEGGDKFVSTMQDQLQSINDQTIAMVNNGSGIQAARAAQRGWISDAVDLARAAGIPEGAIRRMVDTFGTVPRELLVDVEQRGAEEVQGEAHETTRAVNAIPKNHDTAIRGQNTQAIAAINEARRAAEAWARMTYTAQLAVSTQGLGPIQGAHGRRAGGGPVESGLPYVVGERGPELFVPGASGTIVPNDKATGGRAVGHGGGNELHLHFGDVYGDPEAFARSIAPIVGRELAAIDRGV
jgi:hypothetical protein